MVEREAIGLERDGARPGREGLVHNITLNSEITALTAMIIQTHILLYNYM